MPLPLTEPDTLCEARGPDLPPAPVPLARTWHALARARTRHTPEPRGRGVLWYGGVDQAWRAVAGTRTALYEPRTAHASGPWRTAGRRQRLPPPAVTALPPGLRFVVLDATTGQAPGAPGPAQRLHIRLALVS